MADATTAKTEKAPKTPATPSALTSGSKTLFVGYLSYSVKRADVEEFFKGAGEVVDVRFASNEEGVFEGFGHVEFATGASAHKVSGCQLNCYSNCFGFHGHPQQPCCFCEITLRAMCAEIDMVFLVHAYADAWFFVVPSHGWRSIKSSNHQINGLDHRIMEPPCTRLKN